MNRESLEDTMRCAIYARYSSDLQNDRSIEDQIRKCREFANRSGWHVLDGHIYTDRAVSGTTVAGRSGLLDLMKVAGQTPQPFNYILVEDTSRLSRDKLEQAQTIQDLKDNGVNIYFVADAIDTTDEVSEDIILPIHGIKNSLYIRDLSKRTNRGMEGQVLKGYNSGGRTYGYRYSRVPDPGGGLDKKTGQPKSLGTKIEIDQEQAPVVRTIFAMYASGYGLKAIASRLNEQGIEPPRAASQRARRSGPPTWAPSAIREMLRNAKYVGDWTWNKTKWVRNRKTGKRVCLPRPAEEWVKHENRELAIVDDAIWRAVQQKVSENKARYAAGDRAPRRSYLLSGVMKCGVCGASLIVVRCYGGDAIEYGCSFNWHRGAKACPNNIRVRRVALENKVIAAIRDRVLNPDAISLLVEKVNAEVRRRLAGIDAEIKRLHSMRNRTWGETKNLVDYIADGGPSEVVREAIREKETALAELDAKISDCTERDRYRELTVDSKAIVAWIDRLSDLIAKDTATARVEISNLLGELTAAPVSHKSQAGFLLKGRPKIDGILGVVADVSTLNGSGGRI